MPTIQLASGPQDVSVNEGGSTSLNCTFTGTRDVPDWIINGVTYSSSSLPPRHSWFNQRLTIINVNMSDNGTTYQCVVIPIFSGIATLTVVLEGQLLIAIMK